MKAKTTQVRLKTPKKAVLYYPGTDGVSVKVEFTKASLGKDFCFTTVLSDSEMKALGAKNFTVES